MAITGKLVFASIQFEPQVLDTPPLKASVTLIDDVLGVVGQRNIPVNDANTVALVMQFVEQMLPSLSEQAGFPISLPPVANTTSHEP